MSVTAQSSAGLALFATTAHGQDMYQRVKAFISAHIEPIETQLCGSASMAG